MNDFDATVKNVDLKEVKDNPFREKKSALDKLRKELDGIDEIAIQEKPIEQFRQEIVDSIFRAITKETDRSVFFVQKADYVRAKFCDYKIEGLHKAMNIMLEASTIGVKEG